MPQYQQIWSKMKAQRHPDVDMNNTEGQWDSQMLHMMRRIRAEAVEHVLIEVRPPGCK